MITTHQQNTMMELITVGAWVVTFFCIRFAIKKEIKSWKKIWNKKNEINNH